MNKIFLIIFVFHYIKADDDESNEKYIDLLPEEEKQGFLNRIARRISEGVSSPDPPNDSHVEVNEDQLDAQNDYVKQIIKEESTILENEKRDDLLRNYQETGNNKEDKNSDNEPHIDLTLRAQSREERTGSELNKYLRTTSELKVIPVLNDQENLNNSAIKPESNVEIKAIREKDITIELEKGIKSESITANDSKSTEKINIIRKSYDKFRTTISNYDPSSEENTSATEDEITVSNSTISPDNIDNANTTETDSEIIWISTKKIYDTESYENVNSGSSETTSTLSTLSTLTNGELVTTSSVTNLTSETEKRITTSKKQEITTSKTTDSSKFNQTRNKNKKIMRNKHLYVRSGDGDLKNVSNATQLKHNNKSDLKTNENDTDPVNEIVNDTISETNMMNTDDTKSKTSDGKSIYLDNDNKENITELKTKESHISLRATYDSRESGIDVSQEHNLKSDAKVYEVFEVAADKPPFVMKSNVEIKDTPYYVPVYNYAPDRAYFKPRSRFGPNADDTNEDKKNYFETYKNSDEDSANIRSIFSGYNKKEKAVYGSKPGRYRIKQKNDNIFELIRPIKMNNYQDIYYNPNDYLDMDYYFGRTYINPLRYGHEGKDDDEQGFPNTDEEDHPYSSIHSSDSVKDHVRAVRKLLYLKQIYEPLPEEKKEPRKFYDKRMQRQNNDTKYNKRNELRYNNDDNIAIDYYFGILPNNKAVQGVTIDKPNNNKLLRNPEKTEIIKTIEYDDQLNESKFISKTSIEMKPSTPLDKVLESILDVLRDFIRFDNQALSRYNWLKSTVDILAALKKLLELTKQLQFQEPIHPKDLELLKYVIYLYKSSVNKLKTEIVDQNLNPIKKSNRKGVKDNETVKQNKSIMPKNKWNNKIREPLKLWLEVSSFLRSGDEKEERVKLLYDFEDFLQNVLYSLHDFHDAIKHIAIITKYNNQKWYDDLKNIYLHNASNEKLLTLLLHVSVTKLLNSIETSAKDGAENNFKNYIINNKQYVQRSREEFLFVLKILHELRRMNKH